MRQDFKRGLIVLVFGIMGMTLAQILRVAHDAGRVVDEYVSGSITLTDMMAIPFFACFIIGIIVAYKQR